MNAPRSLASGGWPPTAPTSLAVRVRRMLEGRGRAPARTVLTLGGLSLLAVCCWLLNPVSTPATVPLSSKRPGASSAEKRLRLDVPQFLVGADAKPHTWPLVLGQGATHIERQADGTLTIVTLTHCLLEFLPPDNKRGGYRLTLTMRLTDAGFLGAGGVYFGRIPHRAGLGLGHTFAEALFSDPAAADGAAQAAADGMLHLAVRHLLAVAGERPRSYRFGMEGRLPMETKQHADGGTLWRTFTLEVLPALVRIKSGANVREVPRAAWHRHLGLLKRLHPFLGDIANEISPRGGCGIYLYRGTMQLRELRCEPIVQPE